MMTIRRVILLSLLAAVGGAPVGLRAQRAGVVLALPASARAAGAGDALSLATGADALFYGAQNLPRERSVAASAGTWLGNAQFATVAGSFPLGRNAVAGLGVQSLDYGSADEYVSDPLTAGTRGIATGDQVGASETALAAAVQLRRGTMRHAVTVEYVHQQVANLAASTVAFSWGFGIARRGWDLALGVQHGAGRMTLGAITSTLVWTRRAALRSSSVAVGGWQWAGVAEWRDVRGEGRAALAGVEGTVATHAGWQLTVRGAAVSQPAETAREPWTAGGSAARGAWSLDYGYQGFGALGVVHRMGVTWRSRGPRSPSR